MCKPTGYATFQAADKAVTKYDVATTTVHT